MKKSRWIHGKILMSKHILLKVKTKVYIFVSVLPPIRFKDIHWSNGSHVVFS